VLRKYPYNNNNIHTQLKLYVVSIRIDILTTFTTDNHINPLTNEDSLTRDKRLDIFFRASKDGKVACFQAIALDASRLLTPIIIHIQHALRYTKKGPPPKSKPHVTKMSGVERLQRQTQSLTKCGLWRTAPCLEV